MGHGTCSQVVERLQPNHRIPGQQLILRKRTPGKRIIFANAIECFDWIPVRETQQQRASRAWMKRTGREQHAFRVQLAKILAMFVDMRRNFVERATIPNDGQGVH